MGFFNTDDDFTYEKEFIDFLHKYNLKLRNEKKGSAETIIIYALWKEIQKLK